jgi:nucleotide-binding universal stress UspA family protein
MHSGPVVIGFDGSPAAERALREGAAVVGSRPALVVVVWEAGRSFDLLTAPTVDLPLATLDVSQALELDQEMYEEAQQLAQQGAALAIEVGLKAEGLAVADESSVADTLVRVARERDAPALVVGSHGHRGIHRVLLGGTTQELLQRAPCPVVVVRAEKSERPH